MLNLQYRLLVEGKIGITSVLLFYAFTLYTLKKELMGVAP